MVKNTTKPEAPLFLIVRAAGRLHRLPASMRDGYVERAKSRLNGKHPRAWDAAVAKAAG